MLTLRVLGMSLLVLALSAASAHAGRPAIIGNADNAEPTVTAGPAGVFHVVYNDPDANVYVYCQILIADTRDCTNRASLPFNDAQDQGPNGAPGKGWIVRDEDSGTLYLVNAQYASGRTWARTSTDNGVTWSAPKQIHGRPPAEGAGTSNGTNSERPVQYPAAAKIAFPTFNVGPRVYGARVDGSDAGDDTYATLADGGHSGLAYNFSLGYDPGGSVATADDLEGVYFWRQPNGSTLEDAAAWGSPTFIAKGTDSTMHGRGTPWLGYTSRGSAKRPFVMRKWTGDAFGSPFVVEKTQAYLADVYVSDGGEPGVVYRRNDVGLRYAELAPNGKSFATKTIATTDEVFSDLNFARDDDGNGIAVFTRDAAIVASDLTEVRDPDTPRKSVVTTVAGKTLGLNVEGSCVVPGKKTSVSTNGQGVGRLEKVVYRLGNEKVTDEKEKWGAKLTVPKGAAPGAELAISALMTIEHKGKRTQRTLETTVTVCGG